MTTDRRQFVFGGVLLAAAGAAEWGRPHAPIAPAAPDALARAVPAVIGPYRYRSSDDIVLPPRDEVSLAIYQQYLARIYTAEGLPPITLLIAYGASQDYMLQVHRPESCYPVAGYALGQSRRLPLTLPTGRSIEAVELTATRLGREDLILYWVRVGDAFPPTLWLQRAVTARYALTGRATDGVLVRLSAPHDGSDTLAALVRFQGLLINSLRPFARRVVLGDRTDAGVTA